MELKRLLVLIAAVSAVQLRSDKEAKATFPELCIMHGYNVEEHKVTTEDGYILTLFRIPGKSGEPVTNSKPVVFLMHGLLDLSFTWITNDPKLAPGFIMADSGFDVWLGNSRGSYYSTDHTSLNPKKDKAYWRFSWQEMAQYDLPTSIEYVLANTGHERLTYVGHSQGSLQMFALLSDRPDFSSKLSLFIALGPVATVKHMNVKYINELSELHAIELFKVFGVNEFLPYPGVPTLTYAACSVLNFACASVIQLVADQVVAEDNTERFPVILAHEPGGTSVQNIAHWTQMVDYSSYRLQKFNYGKTENMRVYGQETPPVYDLTKIDVPIALFAGEQDRLADPTDVSWLRTQLGTVVHFETLQSGHLTFVWGKDMTYLQKVTELAKQYA